MTWGELKKCRARSRSSERLGVGVGDACSDEELGGGVSVERGSDSDGDADGCELSSLLAVMVVVPVPRAGIDPRLAFYSLLAQQLSL
jgi:hypothetical protein